MKHVEHIGIAVKGQYLRYAQANKDWVNASDCFENREIIMLNKKAV